MKIYSRVLDEIYPELNHCLSFWEWYFDSWFIPIHVMTTLNHIGISPSLVLRKYNCQKRKGFSPPCCASRRISSSKTSGIWLAQSPSPPTKPNNNVQYTGIDENDGLNSTGNKSGFRRHFVPGTDLWQLQQNSSPLNELTSKYPEIHFCFAVEPIQHRRCWW